MKTPRLTKRLLRAMEEALTLVDGTPRGGDLPDEEDMGPDDPTDEDFERAMEWVQAELARRKP